MASVWDFFPSWLLHSEAIFQPGVLREKRKFIFLGSFLKLVAVSQREESHFYSKRHILSLRSVKSGA